MLNEDDILAVLLTLKLAFISTSLLILIGTPIAWWLSQTKSRWRVWVETVIALPLVLPPTVIGFYLLLALGPTGPIGNLTQTLGGASLAFTFSGLVIGSLFYSLPFVVQPLQAAFNAIGPRPLEAAATLRAAPLDRFISIVLPLSIPGYLSAAALGFAHTLGEFGIVLMIGGNIPGETQTASIAIYEHVETLQYQNAHWLAGGMLLFSFLLLSLAYAMNRRFNNLSNHH